MKSTKSINDTYWPYYIFQHFIDSLEQLGYAETTRKSYQFQLKRFGAILIELGYKHHDESLTSLPIFYKTLVEHHKRLLKTAGRKGISNACLNQYISAWNRFCRWYGNSGVQQKHPRHSNSRWQTKYLRHSSVGSCRSFKVYPKLPCIVELDKLVWKEPDDFQDYHSLRQWCIVDLLSTAALRVNEIRHLRIQNISLKHQAVMLQNGFAHPRNIYLDNKSTTYLSQYLRLLQKQLNLPRLPKDMFLFVKKNKPLSKSELYQTTRLVTYHTLGFALTPHQIRIACGRTLFFKCKDERLIQEFMGYVTLGPFLKYHSVDIATFKDVLSKYHPRFLRKH